LPSVRGRAAVFAEQIRSCHAPNLPAPPQQALQARQRTKATPLMPRAPTGAASAPEGLWSGEHNPPWRRYPVLSYGLVVFALLGTSAPFALQARIASSTPLFISVMHALQIWLSPSSLLKPKGACRGPELFFCLLLNFFINT